MKFTIGYFPNEKGDFTLTVDDQPVGFVKDEAIAQLFQSLQNEIDNNELWKKEQIAVWGGVDKYMRNHPEMDLGMSISKKVLSMLRERDAIVNILKIAR
jgi:hypothetical protein